MEGILTSGAATLDRWLPTGFLKFSAALTVAGAVTLLVAPHQWPVVVPLLLADQALITAASVWPRSRLLGPNLRRLPPEHAARGEIALTFDDGPDPQVTPEVLRILDRYDAKATFFCIGRHAEAHPELVAAIRERGHRVENHTYEHAHTFAFRGPRAMADDILRAQTVLARGAQPEPVFFRAPAGMRNPWLAGVLGALGLQLVSWTQRGFDSVTRDASKIVARLTRNLRAGDILLLHDGGGALDERGRPVVIEALTGLLEVLRGKGLRPVPLPVEPSRCARRT